MLGLAALAIKLEDGGPVLFRQARVGLDGEDFELLKLRTMVVGAESMGAGAAVNVSARLAGSRQLTDAEAAMMRDPTVVLAGWQPPAN